MGGYGISLAESNHYKVWLKVNCSNENRAYKITIENKKTGVNLDMEELPYNTPQPMLDAFQEEMDKQLTIFRIKDSGLRDKCQFEASYRELEKENIELREHIASLKEKLDTIKKIA